MVKRLTKKQIKYVFTQYKKERSTSEIASEVKVSERHIRRLCARFKETGVPHIPQKPGRKKSQPSQDDTSMVLQEHAHTPVGVLQLARKIRRTYHISYNNVYRIMKENKLVTPSAAKSKKRKGVRFERKYSNAMWHVDWHTMKDSRFRGLQLVTYLDDASRCVLAARIFTQATSENAVLTLRDAIKKFGTPATMLSDNGACFVGRGGRKAPTKSWTPTAFESELLDRGIELINSRPYHPQTNGKLERFHRSIEEEIWHYESLSSYVEYYNEDRLHWSLDIDNYQTPLRAFSDRKATDAIRKSNPRWMEEDIDDGRT